MAVVVMGFMMMVMVRSLKYRHGGKNNGQPTEDRKGNPEMMKAGLMAEQVHGFYVLTYPP